MVSVEEGEAAAEWAARSYDDSLVGVIGGWHCHPVRDRQGLDRVMCRDQRCRSGGEPARAQLGLERGAQCRVEMGGRFVQQVQRRLPGQRTG